MSNQYSAIWIFILAFICSGLSGVAALLRTKSGQEIKSVAVITALLNSGFLGMAISLLWYHKFQDNIYSLLGICVMSGLAGAAGLDFFLTAMQKGGFSINLGKKEDDEKTP